MAIKLENYTSIEYANLAVHCNENGMRVEIITPNVLAYGLESYEKIVDGVPKDMRTDEEYMIEQSKKHTQELIQFNYDEKVKKAYAGIKVLYNGLELIFPTADGDISKIVASLATMGNTETKNWKFWTVDGVPKMVEITKLQLAGLASFGNAMINTCFGIEGSQNEKAYSATVEQLNDTGDGGFIETLKAETVTLMDAVNNEIALESVGG